MANYSTSITIDHTSDTSFRTWGSAISAALNAIGLVQTGDTGQINWSTVTRASANTEAGYEMWRFDDTLQTTVPIFIRVSYRTGSSSSYPALRVACGTGTNGAGSLTGIFSAGSGYWQQTSATTNFMYASSDGSCASLHILNSQFSLGVERFRDDDGDPNSDGWWAAFGYATTVWEVNVVDTIGAVMETHSYPMATIPRPTTSLTSWISDANDVLTLPWFVATRNSISQSKMWLAYLWRDMPAGLTQDINHYGADRSYRSLGEGRPYMGTNPGSIASSNISAFMWWSD